MPSIKKKIKIYCSSFLQSKNVAWFNFKKLLFGEYGEFDTIIKNYDKEDVTVLVIFFQDLFQLNETNPSKIDKKLKHLIKLS